MRAMDDPVEDGAGNGRIAEVLVPAPRRARRPPRRGLAEREVQRCVLIDA
jgi:hypothetical protein